MTSSVSFFSTSRFALDYNRVEAAAAEFLEQDEVASLDDVKEKLDRTCLPSGVVEISQASDLMFLSIKKDGLGVPKICFCLEIKEDLTFDSW